jgi:streptomycin 6-kinase
VEPPALSAPLRRTIGEVGAPAAAWAAQVSDQLQRTCRLWQLHVDGQVHHAGVASLVYEVTTEDGTPAVLKLALPHPESRHEAAALARWDGVGAVRLLRASADGFTLLLERCAPGHDLWERDRDLQLAVLVDLLPRLWVPPGPTPFPSLVTTARAWADELPARARALRLPDGTVRRVRGWVDELTTDDPPCLLHGDLHPGNVLAARRAPWLAIDPKPWVGDPAFDLAQLLSNWLPDGPADAVDLARRTARTLASRLDLDTDRVLRWAAIKAIGWGARRERVLALMAAATP